MADESEEHDLENEDTIRATQLLRARNEDDAINVGFPKEKVLF
jgi:hypothetical protein